ALPAPTLALVAGARGQVAALGPRGGSRVRRPDRPRGGHAALRRLRGADDRGKLADPSDDRPPHARPGWGRPIVPDPGLPGGGRLNYQPEAPVPPGAPPLPGRPPSQLAEVGRTPGPAPGASRYPADPPLVLSDRHIPTEPGGVRACRSRELAG